MRVSSSSLTQRSDPVGTTSADDPEVSSERQEYAPDGHLRAQERYIPATRPEIRSNLRAPALSATNPCAISTVVHPSCSEYNGSSPSKAKTHKRNMDEERRESLALCNLGAPKIDKERDN